MDRIMDVNVNICKHRCERGCEHMDNESLDESISR